MESTIELYLHLLDQNRWQDQEPTIRSLQLPCKSAFTDRYIFSLNLSRIRILSDQLQSKAGTSVDMSKFNSYRSVLMYTGTGLYRGKKNWLLGNYTVALAYYASCRILVMGSGKTKSISILSEFALLILTLVLTGKSFQLIDWKSHKYPVIHLLRCTKKTISCLFLLCTVLNKFQLVITNCWKLVETSP